MQRLKKIQEDSDIEQLYYINIDSERILPYFTSKTQNIIEFCELFDCTYELFFNEIYPECQNIQKMMLDDKFFELASKYIILEKEKNKWTFYPPFLNAKTKNVIDTIKKTIIPFYDVKLPIENNYFKIVVTNESTDGM